MARRSLGRVSLDYVQTDAAVHWEGRMDPALVVQALKPLVPAPEGKCARKGLPYPPVCRFSTKAYNNSCCAFDNPGRPV
jgi:hypothetical protein